MMLVWSSFALWVIRRGSRAEVRLGLEVQLHAEARRLLGLRHGSRAPPRPHKRCSRFGVRGGRLPSKRVIVPSVDLIPVHHVPPRLDVIRAPILVLEVIRMLPDIDAQDGDS